MYKILKDGTVVDVAEDLPCVRMSPMGLLLCRRDESPQGIISSDGEEIWHVSGWADFPEGREADTVTLEEFFDAASYDRLRAELAGAVDLTPEETPEPAAKTIGEILDEQNAKIAELSRQLVAAGKFGGV